MSAANLSTTSEGHWLVSGEIDFDTVITLRKQGDRFIADADQSDLQFDFSGVLHSNSAGLALMLAWLRLAKKTNKQVQFLNIPESLTRVAKVCGVSKWINS